MTPLMSLIIGAAMCWIGLSAYIAYTEWLTKDWRSAARWFFVVALNPIGGLRTYIRHKNSTSTR